MREWYGVEFAKSVKAAQTDIKQEEEETLSSASEPVPKGNFTNSFAFLEDDVDG